MLFLNFPSLSLHVNPVFFSPCYIFSVVCRRIHVLVFFPINAFFPSSLFCPPGKGCSRGPFSLSFFQTFSLFPPVFPFPSGSVQLLFPLINPYFWCPRLETFTLPICFLSFPPPMGRQSLRPPFVNFCSYIKFPHLILFPP